MNNEIETIKEVAEATKEVAKTGNKMLETAQKFGQFIEKYTHGTLTEGMGIFEDKLKYTRYENLIKFMRKVEASEKNYISQQSREIEMKIGIPLFQAATLEENDYLQQKWANMLINASYNSNKKIIRSYINLLEELSYLDVINLDKIYSIPFDKHNDKTDYSICTEKLPKEVYSVYYKKQKRFKLDNQIEVSLANLSRLGLIYGTFMSSGSYSYDAVQQTVLGKNFVDSCRIDEII